MSQENKKKIVAFDSSFLNKIPKTLIDIDNEFPLSDYSRTIQDTVIDEILFNPNPTDSWYEASREEWRESYIKHRFFIMPSQYDILLREYIYDDVSLERKDVFEEQIKLYFKGIHPQQKVREKTHLTLRQKSKEAKKETFNNFLHSDTSSEPFTLSKFEVEIERVIQNNEKKPISIISSNISKLVKRKTTIIMLQGHNLRLYEGNNKEARYIRLFKNLKGQYPTLYNILIYDFFISCPKFIHKNKEGYYIKIGKMKIKINENLLPDFKISLPALYYIDEFATCDKGQAQLIKGLFPDYWHKVKYYKKVTENGKEIYKNCSNEI